jgi:hypothetical protein
MQPAWLAKQEKVAQRYYRAYWEQELRDDNPTLRGSRAVLFPHVLPDEIEGVAMYWHCSNIPYRMLKRALNGCLYIERLTLSTSPRALCDLHTLPALHAFQNLAHTTRPHVHVSTRKVTRKNATLNSTHG